MKKAFLKKMVLAVIATTSISTLSTLGVSAATNNSTANNFYNSILNNKSKAGWVCDNGTWYYYNTAGDVKTGWINDNGRWYFCDNTGAMQTGVIKVNGKTYCLNAAGAIETGNVAVNNKTYKCSLNGQVAGTKIPTSDKIFDSNNNVIKDNNQNSTVSNSNNNQDTTNTGTITNTTTESNTNTGTTTTTGSTTSTGNTTSTGLDTNVGNTNNVGNTANSGTTESTGSNTNTNANSADVQGLPQLPTTYSINVQATAENKILELMNAKRAEAGLQPLTLDNTLVQVARYKSDHMIQYNYFDHVTPQGTKYTDWLQAVGYEYTAAGENIAYNTYDAVELFNQWWNSPGHRANMMNASYTKVGIGVVQGNGKFMGTQEFSN
ncbi:MAG: CAP domain-containing protein [Clostridium sp.]|uniref:CAP domain-containing protein n=1 Tax=Clostridium sp. TaxID=1506 RepID=UPI0025B91BBB|nr:CAP domain-containing protein [Clostridium sp.]MCE5219820.1 CAP domain-containing protein [Clostridium sp.]